MGRANPTVLFGFFVAVIVAMCGATLLKGGFFIAKHEGDTLHLAQIVLRMADGQWPHLDFRTPIGILSFAPIAGFVSAGFGLGTAIGLAQLLFVVTLFPAFFWAAYSRFQGGLAYLFGLVVIVLITGIVHGQTDSSVSISMHYNRWAWAIAFVAIVLGTLPPLAQVRPRVDGVLIGLCLSALLLIKVTYFVAFAPVVLIALLMRRAFPTLLLAILAGLTVLLALTAFASVDFWLGYVRDVATVAASNLRPKPSAELSSVIAAPAYLGGSLVLLLGVVFLRQAREHSAGLILLLLVPGFFWVTYQNYGNDPQWLLLLGIFVLAHLPKLELRNALGWDMRNALKITGILALGFGAPSFLNLAFSPFRHMAADETKYAALIPGSGVHEDLQTLIDRSLVMDVKVPIASLGAAVPSPKGDDDVGMVMGEALPDCQLDAGMTAWFRAVADDMTQQNLAQGGQVFTADILPSLWMFGEFQPLKGGSVWYYRGLAGIENADVLVVPLCPIAQNVRNKILRDIDAAGITLFEVRRTPLYLLFNIVR